MMTPKVDIVFPVTGSTLPVDHGYALYGALSRILESPSEQWLHDTTDIGIQNMRGKFAGQGRLNITPQTRLIVRAPSNWVDRFLPLVGSNLSVDGYSVSIGMPSTRSLRPTASLYAHRVTTRNGDDETRFDSEIANKLASAGIRGRPVRGRRRIFRVRDKHVVAHSLLVSELDARESMLLLEKGLGGRRKLGCGVFVPWSA